MPFGRTVEFSYECNCVLYSAVAHVVSKYELGVCFDGNIIPNTPDALNIYSFELFSAALHFAESPNFIALHVLNH